MSTKFDISGSLLSPGNAENVAAKSFTSQVLVHVLSDESACVCIKLSQVLQKVTTQNVGLLLQLYGRKYEFVFRKARQSYFDWVIMSLYCGYLLMYYLAHNGL